MENRGNGGSILIRVLVDNSLGISAVRLAAQLVGHPVVVLVEEDLLLLESILDFAVLFNHVVVLSDYVLSHSFECIHIG